MTHKIEEKGSAFITFEGGEGSGKSTQMRRLAARLRAHGFRVLETREPGGTPLAETLRGLILALPGNPDFPDSPRAEERITSACEAFLVEAARVQHVTHVVRPALNDGTVVLCDRYTDSTLAYQGFGRGLALPLLRDMNRLATGGLIPNLTLLFDVPVAIGLGRRAQDRGQVDRLDHESQRFHEAVRRGFLSLSEQEPQRIRLIDADRDPDVIADEVFTLVLPQLSVRG